jgi:hypothetical protein
LPFIMVERRPVSLPNHSSTRPAILSIRPLILSCRADLIFGILRSLVSPSVAVAAAVSTVSAAAAAMVVAACSACSA